MAKNPAIPNIPKGFDGVALTTVSAPRLVQPSFKLSASATGTLVNFHFLQQANMVIRELQRRLADAEEARDRALRRNETMTEMLRTTVDDLTDARRTMEIRHFIGEDILQSIAELENRYAHAKT